MKIDQLTWGIFGAHYDQHGNMLIKQRSNGTWDVPGGGMDASETGAVQTLQRELQEEVHLTLQRASRRVGSPLPFYNPKTQVVDIAAIYQVEAAGTPALSDEAHALKFISLDEAMDWLVIRHDDKIIVGPEGRMGRTPTMILDALVVRQEPNAILLASDTMDYNFLYVPSNDFLLSKDGAWLTHFDGTELHAWRRRDPFQDDGYVQPKE